MADSWEPGGGALPFTCTLVLISLKQVLAQVTLRDASRLGMMPTSVMFAPSLMAKYYV